MPWPARGILSRSNRQSVPAQAGDIGSLSVLWTATLFVLGCCSRRLALEQPRWPLLAWPPSVLAAKMPTCIASLLKRLRVRLINELVQEKPEVPRGNRG